MSTRKTADDDGRTRGSPSRWSDLPDELLGEVRSRLIASLRDRVSFASVCKSWRAAASVQPALPVAPLLFLSSTGSDKTDLMCGPNDSWVFRGGCKAANKRFVGSHHGCWVALLDTHNMLLIMNLFSGAAVALSDEQSKIHSISYTIFKIIFSGDPTSSNGCILAAIMDGRFYITLCRIGCRDGRWTTCHWDGKLIDIAFCNGELYGLTSPKEELIKVEIGMEGDIPVVTTIQGLAVQSPTWNVHTHVLNRYIFELYGKLSIAVKTWWMRNLHPFFKVFTLVNVDADEPYKHKWTEVACLGEYALFIWPKGSQAVQVPVSAQHCGLERNRMYYTVYRDKWIPEDAVYSVTSDDGDQIKMYCKKDQSFGDGLERTEYHVMWWNYAMWVYPPEL